jgi:NADH-quinone oxidoreductase subunit M
MTTTLPWLSLLTFAPLLAAVLVGGLLHRPNHGRSARGVALVAHALVLVLTGVVVAGFDTAAGNFQWVERHAWVPSLGIEYHLGIDGLGLVAILLSAAIPFFAALLADRVAVGREALYHALLLILQCGLFGAFTALNFFHWFLFWEVSLVPAYLMVRLFGGERAGAASFQFFVYTMVGSVALLLAFLALRAAGGSFDFQELAEFGRSGRLAAALAEQLPWAGFVASGEAMAWLVFAGVLLGFAVKVPLWPFHTWLPDTYTEAPSTVTMVLTGVLSKMGVYGILRIAMPIFPQQFSAVQPLLLGLALATVVLPALAAFAQQDLKRVLAYSSVNHLGYCLLGLFVVSPGGGGREWLDGVAAPALNGVILQMLNHGLTAATLFGLVEVLERRTEGMRDYAQLGGLRTVAPVYCGLAGISVFASVGLPGLNGFVSEFLIFRGAFGGAPWAAAIAVIGLLATAIFLLTVLERMFHGPLDEGWAGFSDLSLRERVQFGVPVGLMLVLGIFPDLLLRLTNATVLQLARGI